MVSKRATDELRELFVAAGALPFGTEKVSVLMRAVAVADTLDDLDEQFSSRETLISAATFGNRPDVSLSAFAWCLTTCDKHPEQFPIERLLWQYKWIVVSLFELRDITKGDIEQIFGDMVARYEAKGWGRKGPLSCRLWNAMGMGDRRAASELYAKWRKSNSDLGQDCAACETDTAVTHYIFVKKFSDAFSYAAPLIEGKHKCETVPQRTLCRLLIPYFLAGRIDDAIEAYRRTKSKLLRTEGVIEHSAAHVAFLVMTQNREMAISLTERTLRTVLASTLSASKVHYYGAMALLFSQLHKPNANEVRFRTATTFPLYSSAGTYDAEELANWALKEATELALALDTRNENSYYNSLVQGYQAFSERTRALDLT